MPPELTTESWVQIRHDYEHSDKPIEVICAEHGISSGTLRDRMRRWRWTRRRPPIPPDGPPPAARSIPAPPASIWDCDGDAPVTLIEPDDLPSPHVALGGDVAVQAAPDERAIVPRLQGAVARVLPAIEATVGKLAAGPLPPRQLEQTARALGALTRTLRELNGLLSQRLADAPPVDVEALRQSLAQKLIALLDEPDDPEDGDGGDWEGDGEAQPQANGGGQA